MTTLENKRNDIITLAKGAEVDTYVPQVHVYNMIHIIYDEQKNGVQGARKGEYNLENCKNTYENTVMKIIEQINVDNNDKDKNKIRIDNMIKYGKRS